MKIRTKPNRNVLQKGKFDCIHDRDAETYTSVTQTGGIRRKQSPQSASVMRMKVIRLCCLGPAGTTSVSGSCGA